MTEFHVVEFDVTGRPMRGWFVVEADGLEPDNQLRNHYKALTLGHTVG